MPVKSFSDLEVWKIAHELVLNVYKKTKAFPEEEKFGLVSQLRRSAVSICSNIAEGGTKSRKDFVRFLEIARASLEETKYHFILARDLGYLLDGEFIELINKGDEIGKKLYRMIQSLRELPMDSHSSNS